MFKNLEAKLGFALIEIMLFAGIATAVGGVAYVNYKSNSQNNSVKIQGGYLTQLDKSIQSSFVAANDFNNLNNTNLIALGVVPPQMIQDGNLTTIWGTPIIVGPATVNGQPGYSITLTGANNNACVQLATENGKNFYQIGARAETSNSAGTNSPSTFSPNIKNATSVITASSSTNVETATQFCYNDRNVSTISFSNLRLKGSDPIIATTTTSNPNNPTNFVNPTSGVAPGTGTGRTSATVGNTATGVASSAPIIGTAPILNNGTQIKCNIPPYSTNPAWTGPCPNTRNIGPDQATAPPNQGDFDYCRPSTAICGTRYDSTAFSNLPDGTPDGPFLHPELICLSDAQLMAYQVANYGGSEFGGVSDGSVAFIPDSTVCPPPIPPTGATITGSVDATENGVKGQFTVTLSDPAPAGGTDVNFTIASFAGGDATFGGSNSDFDISTGAGVSLVSAGNWRIRINAGATSRTISVDALDDIKIEGTERIRLVLQNGTGYTPNFTAASINLIDNDIASTLTFTPVKIATGLNSSLSWTTGGAGRGVTGARIDCTTAGYGLNIPNGQLSSGSRTVGSAWIDGVYNCTLTVTGINASDTQTATATLTIAPLSTCSDFSALHAGGGTIVMTYTTNGALVAPIVRSVITNTGNASLTATVDGFDNNYGGGIYAKEYTINMSLGGPGTYSIAGSAFDSAGIQSCGSAIIVTVPTPTTSKVNVIPTGTAGFSGNAWVGTANLYKNFDGTMGDGPFVGGGVSGARQTAPPQMNCKYSNNVSFFNFIDPAPNYGAVNYGQNIYFAKWAWTSTPAETYYPISLSPNVSDDNICNFIFTTNLGNFTISTDTFSIKPNSAACPITTTLTGTAGNINTQYDNMPATGKPFTRVYTEVFQGGTAVTNANSAYSTGGAAVATFNNNIAVSAGAYEVRTTTYIEYADNMGQLQFGQPVICESKNVTVP